MIRLETAQTSDDGSHFIDPRGDPLQTLKNLQAYYECPHDAAGKLAGPIAGFTADHPRGDGTKWVSTNYIDFSQADPYPAVLDFFCDVLTPKVHSKGLRPNIIVAGPWAGLKFSQEASRQLGCRGIFAEKDIVGFDDQQKKIERLILGRYKGMIRKGESVAIGEELVNNLSTTQKLVDLIEEEGGMVTSIICAINRSFKPHRREFQLADGRIIPILGVIEGPMPQHHQSEPKIAEAIARYGLVRKPKYEWDRLKAAMDTHGIQS